MALSATNQASFIDLLPPKPFCADNYNFGTVIRNKAHALTYQHIQLNSPFKFNFISLDIDYDISKDLCFVWENNNLPEPTYAVINPANNHAHLDFQLENPVYANNEKQLKYYEDVKSILTHLYKADQNFTGTLTKTPFHKNWITIESDITYTLAELKAYAPKLMPYGPKNTDNIIRFNKFKRRTIDYNTGNLGHKCLLFETSRIRAYTAVNDFYTQEAFFDHMMVVCNEENPSDLNIHDITSTAKSISHYTWKHRAWFTGKRFVRSRVTSIEDLRNRQRTAATATAGTRHAKTLAIIEQAINNILKQAIAMPALTKQYLAKLTGKSLSTIKRYAVEIDQFIRCAYQALSPVLTPQEEKDEIKPLALPAQLNAPSRLPTPKEPTLTLPPTRSPLLNQIQKPFLALVPKNDNNQSGERSSTKKFKFKLNGSLSDPPEMPLDLTVSKFETNHPATSTHHDSQKALDGILELIEQMRLASIFDPNSS